MNLLLVEPAEVKDGACMLEGRRATHVRAVLGAKPGDAIRAGVIGGAAGTATLVADDGTTMTLRLDLGAGAPAPAVMPVELVLAVPRPKVIARAVEIAASFAVRRVDLTNAWRVDKSYLTSPKLAPAALAASARLGAEQGATTHVPEVAVHRRLMALLDARWPAGGAPGARLLAHPGAPPVETIAWPRGEVVTLAIGPEGGWIQRELDTLVARGFQPISLGAPILRVEAAIAAALGQLMLLARMAR